jgi:hypothetical protein
VHAIEGTISRLSEGTNNAFALRSFRRLLTCHRVDYVREVPLGDICAASIDHLVGTHH